MSKLQASVEGQVIQFLALPKIFSSLGSDLPSGKIKLGNGEYAYWRLHRNLTDLKRKHKNMRDTVTRLTEAFKTIVRSKDFANHYGLKAAPEVPEDHELQSLFRNLLSQNTNRVSYTSTYFGGQRPRVEAIQVTMGNMVFVNAHKGMENPPPAEGITGKIWLDKKKPEEFFTFSVVSPVVKLGGLISADRLAQEITTKIKQNLPDLIRALRFEFDPGQFNSYLDNGLNQLAEKHNSGNNNKGRKDQKQKGEHGRGQTPHITHLDEAATIKASEPAESFESSTEEKVLTTLIVDAEDGCVELEEARGMPREEFLSQYAAADHANGTFALVYDLRGSVVKKLTANEGQWDETTPKVQPANADAPAGGEAAAEVVVEHHKV